MMFRLSLLSAVLLTGGVAADSPLWFDAPASHFTEAVPLGNGRLGAMPFGGVAFERVLLNETGMWSGSPQDADRPDAAAALPEIRRLLSTIARNRIVRMFLRIDVDESIEEIASAVVDLAKKKQGALIIIVRGTGMKSVSESGIILQARVSRALLLSIFNPKSPLHDGAVIVNDRIIEAARCTLPLSAATRVGDIVLGMRHRAALGISEQADVISVVVSEETGTISLAEDGVLMRGLKSQELRKELRGRLVLSMERSWKNIWQAVRDEV